MRKPAITRTIKTLNVGVLGLNIKTCYPENKVLPIFESEAPKDESKLFEYVRRMYETDDFKISTIVSKDIVKRTYEMPLADFIARAEIVEEDTDKSPEEATDMSPVED